MLLMQSSLSTESARVWRSLRRRAERREDGKRETNFSMNLPESCVGWSPMVYIFYQEKRDVAGPPRVSEAAHIGEKGPAKEAGGFRGLLAVVRTNHSIEKSRKQQEASQPEAIRPNSSFHLLTLTNARLAETRLSVVEVNKRSTY